MPFCNVSIVDFEQVNVGWGFSVFIINFEHIQHYESTVFTKKTFTCSEFKIKTLK